MYSFKVIDITDEKSVANFAFGLINTEKEDGFHWLVTDGKTLSRSFSSRP